jgi:hypothetical protein
MSTYAALLEVHATAMAVALIQASPHRLPTQR